MGPGQGLSLRAPYPQRSPTCPKDPDPILFPWFQEFSPWGVLPMTWRTQESRC